MSIPTSKYTKKELFGVRTKLIPEMITRTLKQDFDHVVLIVGDEGMGKSTLAILLADLIIKTRNKNFNKNDKLIIQDTIFYDLQDLEDNIFDKSSSGDVKIIDEGAITGGYKRQAMSKNNKSLNETLFTCRSRNQILLFLIPDINSADSGLLRRATSVIRVVARGHAWVYNEKEKRFMIGWDKKYKRYRFKRRPYLHLEKYRDVQTILGESIWNDYVKHKEDSLRDRHKPKQQDTQQKEIVYLTPKEVRDKYKISNPTLIKRRNDGIYKSIKQGNKYLYIEQSIIDSLSENLTDINSSKVSAGVNVRREDE